jgi:hypothetical protein
MIVDAHLVKLRSIDAVKPVRGSGKLDGAAILDDWFGGPTRTRQESCQDRKVKAHRSIGFRLEAALKTNSLSHDSQVSARPTAIGIQP